MYTEKINKVALSSNDNKRIQTFDRATTFPQETPAVKVCENEMLGVCKAKETSKMLSKECENDLYVTCIIFLSYMKTKSAREMKKYFFITKIQNKRELQQIATNHSSDSSFKDFINIYREGTVGPCSFFVNDTMLASDNPLRFRKLFLKYNKNHDN